MPKRRVHIERTPPDGQRVAIYLDGVRVAGLVTYTLIEGVSRPPRLILEIQPTAIVWGAPAEAVTRPHHPCRDPECATPSGKIACHTCGEAWPCTASQKA